MKYLNKKIFKIAIFKEHGTFILHKYPFNLNNETRQNNEFRNIFYSIENNEQIFIKLILTYNLNEK